MPAETEPIAGAVRLRPLAPGVHVVRQKSWSGLTVAIYFLEGSDGLSLVDAGFPNRVEDLSRAAEALGYRLQDVVRVLYTHTHIDHMGGGPALAEAVPDSEHVIWHEAAHVAEDWPAHNRSMEGWRLWLSRLIPAGDFEAALERHRTATLSARREQRGGPKRIAPVRALRPGERVPAGPFALEALAAPGHDPHHVILYDRDARVAFSGDVVLPVPTPVARPMGDDTATYLATLDDLERRDIDLAYPGHGAPITRWASRVARSRRFVLERIEAIKAELARGERLTTYELAQRGAGQWADDPARFPVVLANIDSSVQYLLARGEIVREGQQLRLTPLVAGG